MTRDKAGWLGGGRILWSLAIMAALFLGWQGPAVQLMRLFLQRQMNPSASQPAQSTPPDQTETIILAVDTKNSPSGYTVPDTTATIWILPLDIPGQPTPTPTILTTTAVLSVSRPWRVPPGSPIPPRAALAVEISSNLVQIAHGGVYLPNSKFGALTVGQKDAVMYVAPTQVVRGRVLDSKGKPIQGVLVAGGRIEDLTDSDGRFLLGVPLLKKEYGTFEGDFTLRKTGYRTTSDDVQLTVWTDGTSTEVLDKGDLTMAPGTAVGGRVVDGNRRPVPRAFVRIYGRPDGPQPLSLFTEEVRADPWGRYESTLPYVPLEVLAVAEFAGSGGFNSPIRIESVPEGQTASLETIIIQPKLDIPFDVVTNDGTSVPCHTTIHYRFRPPHWPDLDPTDRYGLQRGSWDYSMPGPSNTRGFGDFSMPSSTNTQVFFRGQIPGSVLLIETDSKADGLTPLMTTTVTETLAKRGVVLVIQPRRVLRGVVMDTHGNRLFGGSYSARNETGSGDWSGRVNFDGTFRITDLPPHITKLNFSYPGFENTVLSIPGPKELCNPLVVQLKPLPRESPSKVGSPTVKSLIFQVRDSQTSEPIPGVSVGLQPEYTELQRPTPGVLEVRFVDHFGLKEVEIGAPGWHWQLVSADHPSGTTVTVTLTRESRIRGRALDEKGEPVALQAIDASFRASSLQPLLRSWSKSDVSRTRQDGTFEVSGLQSGKGGFRLTPDGNFYSRSLEATISKPGETVDIGDVVFKPGLVLEVLVLDELTGRPIPNAHLGLADQSRSDPISEAVTNDQGLARFIKLVPGRYRLGPVGQISNFSCVFGLFHVEVYPRPVTTTTAVLGSGVLEMELPGSNRRGYGGLVLYFGRAHRNLSLMGALSGTLRVANLPQGHYYLSPGDWSAGPRASLWQSEIVPGQTLKADLYAQFGVRRITLHIRNSDGKPLSNPSYILETKSTKSQPQLASGNTPPVILDNAEDPIQAILVRDARLGWGRATRSDIDALKDNEPLVVQVRPESPHRLIVLPVNDAGATIPIHRLSGTYADGAGYAGYVPANGEPPYILLPQPGPIPIRTATANHRSGPMTAVVGDGPVTTVTLVHEALGHLTLHHDHLPERPADSSAYKSLGILQMERVGSGSVPVHRTITTSTIHLSNLTPGLYQSTFTSLRQPGPVAGQIRIKPLTTATVTIGRTPDGRETMTQDP